MKANDGNKPRNDMWSVEREKHQLRLELRRIERELGARADHLRHQFPRMALNSLLPGDVPEDTLLQRAYKTLSKTLQDESVQGKLIGLGLTLAEWALIRIGVPALWNKIRHRGSAAEPKA